MSAACWAVIPAAGRGSRFGGRTPKQYLSIHGKTVLEHSLRPFCEHPAVKGVVVATAADDAYWPTLAVAGHARVRHVVGGKERCHSVLNGLRGLPEDAAEEDWVLAHDAARPCVRPADIDALLRELRAHPVGGALAMPVRDTMKRTNPQAEVTETVERELLWHALTPQMFRLGMLRTALQDALDNGRLATDETQAIELRGLRPKLVACGAHNIKITRAEDLPLAEFYLRRC